MLRLLRIIRLAWHELGRNLGRTLLTMLGIIIGVSAVISMVALGQGARDAVQASIASMGSNVIFLTSGASNSGGARGGAGSVLNLKAADLDALLECLSVKYVSPYFHRNFQVICEGENTSTTIQGVSVDYFSIRQWPVVEGDAFSEYQQQGAAKVCDIGQTVRKDLFPNENALGKSIRIRGVPFKVLGVLMAKGQNSFGQDQDDIIMAPYTTVMKHLSRTDRIDSIYLSAVSEERTPVAVAEVTALMRQRHHLHEGDDDDFTVRTQEEIASAADESNRTFTLLLAGVASVSLLVGGIGIMNIMLVSVTERIKEIGTRMAVGARASDIRTQFFVEALVMSMLGGTLGVSLGIGGSFVANRYWAPSVVSVSSILLAFTCSFGVGMFFGFYPAVKASQLDPIEALRHE